MAAVAATSFVPADTDADTEADAADAADSAAATGADAARAVDAGPRPHQNIDARASAPTAPRLAQAMACGERRRGRSNTSRAAWSTMRWLTRADPPT